MREYSVRNPSLGAADGLLDIDLKPPPYDAGRVSPDDGEGLRLDRELDDRRRRRPGGKGGKRALVLAGWAGVLGVVLSVAYFTQPGRGLDDDTDAPPQVAQPADALGEPVTAASIASDPERFAQATTAPELPAPTDAAGAPPESLTIAAAPAAANPDAAAAVTPTAPPSAVVKAEAVDQSAAKPDLAPPKAKVRKASDEPIEKPAPKPARVKVERASADADDPLAAKLARREADAAAKAKDLPQLKARIGRAYALAVKAGTPKTVLKARQAEWAVLRAKAERKGPAAVAALYRTRAAQLEALARKAPAHARSKA